MNRADPNDYLLSYGERFASRMCMVLVALIACGCEQKRGEISQGRLTFSGPAGVVVANARSVVEGSLGRIVYVIYENNAPKRYIPVSPSSSYETGDSGDVYDNQTNAYVLIQRWRPDRNSLYLWGRDFDLSRGQVFILEWTAGKPKVFQLKHCFEEVSGVDINTMSGYCREQLGILAKKNDAVRAFVDRSTGGHSDDAGRSETAKDQPTDIGSAPGAPTLEEGD